VAEMGKESKEIAVGIFDAGSRFRTTGPELREREREREKILIKNV
jgi:hypothetical protein